MKRIYSIIVLLFLVSCTPDEVQDCNCLTVKNVAYQSTPSTLPNIPQWIRTYTFENNCTGELTTVRSGYLIMEVGQVKCN